MDTWTFESIGANGSGTTTKGRWRRGLFDCNGTTCCCVFFCFPCTVAQAQSVARGGAGRLCLVIAVAVIVLNLAAQSVTTIDQADAAPTSTGVQVAGALSALGGLVLFVAVCNARSIVRAKDDIEPECCDSPAVSDCLISYFCSMCVVCQLFSHWGFNDDVPYMGACHPYSEGIATVV